MADHARFTVLGEAFLDHLQHNRGRSKRTAEAYALALDRLLAFAGERDPLALTADELDLFTGVWLHKQGVQARSRRTYVAAVRTFYSYAAAKRAIAADPARGVPYPKTGRRLPRVITLENAERLMWAPDFSTFEGVRDGAILAVLVGLGLRASGLVRLNESDLTMDSVDGAPRILVRVIEKGDKERRLPLPKEADLLLRMYLEHPELKEIDRDIGNGDRVLFVSRHRRVSAHEYHGEMRRLTRKAIWRIVRRYGEEAGVPETQLHPHALRHLYGTELAESEVDLVLRQKLMGHADAKSTEIYDHTALRRIVREVDRANPLAKMRTPVSELLAKLAKGTKT